MVLVLSLSPRLAKCELLESRILSTLKEYGMNINISLSEMQKSDLLGKL